MILAAMNAIFNAGLIIYATTEAENYDYLVQFVGKTS